MGFGDDLARQFVRDARVILHGVRLSRLVIDELTALLDVEARALGEPVLVTGSLYLLADLAKDESVRWRTLATG